MRRTAPPGRPRCCSTARSTRDSCTVTGLGSFDFVHDLARHAISDALDAEARAARAPRHRAGTGATATPTAAQVAAQWAARRWRGCRHQDDRVVGAGGRCRVARARPAFGRGMVPRRGRPGRRSAHSGAPARCGSRGRSVRSAIPPVRRRCARRWGSARRLDDSELLVAGRVDPDADLDVDTHADAPSSGFELLTEGSSRATSPGVRAQLLARLANELMLTRDWSEARTLADEAVARGAARTAMSPCCPRSSCGTSRPTSTPHNLEERRRNAHEAVAFAAVGHDPIQRFFSLSTAAVVRDRSGGHRGGRRLHRHRVRAGSRAANFPNCRTTWSASVSWRTGLAGDLAEAERLALGAAELGRRGGIANADIGPTLQVGWIRWQQGRFAELLPLLDNPDAERTGCARSCWRGRSPASPSVSPRRPTCLARAARSRFRRSAARPVVVGVADRGRGDELHARRRQRTGRIVQTMLEPFSEQTSFTGCWVLAPLAYGAALAGGGRVRPGVR